MRCLIILQVSGEHVYNGIYSCAISIFKHEGGVRALYRGFTPTGKLNHVHVCPECSFQF